MTFSQLKARAPMPQQIKTDRLKLRRPENDDVEAVADALTNFEVSKMRSRVPRPYFQEDAREWFDHISATSDETVYVLNKDNNRQAIGAATFGYKSNCRYLGYWLNQADWGHGFMSEALSSAIPFAFESDPETKIQANVFVDNPSSFRLLTKLGFKLVGRTDQFSKSRHQMMSALVLELEPANINFSAKSF